MVRTPQPEHSCSLQDKDLQAENSYRDHTTGTNPQGVCAQSLLASPFERWVTNQASCQPQAPTKGKMKQPQTTGLQFRSTVMQHEPNTISNIVSACHANVIISKFLFGRKIHFSNSIQEQP